MITNLTAAAVYAPEKCKEEIQEIAAGVDFETRPLAKALGVSYPTLIRVLKRLEIYDTIREDWKKRKKDKRAAGK